jgi:methanol--5-hydroxybenzimidazolylcobamide Co-methyltransferase
VRHYSSLAVGKASDLLFGQAPKPLRTRKGMTIGGGLVYPELNFTLPTMPVEEKTMPDVLWHYRDIITNATKRAVRRTRSGGLIARRCWWTAWRRRGRSMG